MSHMYSFIISLLCGAWGRNVRTYIVTKGNLAADSSVDGAISTVILLCKLQLPQDSGNNGNRKGRACNWFISEDSIFVLLFRLLVSYSFSVRGNIWCLDVRFSAPGATIRNKKKDDAKKIRNWRRDRCLDGFLAIGICKSGTYSCLTLMWKNRISAESFRQRTDFFSVSFPLPGRIAANKETVAFTLRSGLIA